MPRLEIVANVAILVSALTATAVGLDRLMDARVSAPIMSAAYGPGETLNTGGRIDYSTAAQNLVVVIDTECRYCGEVMPLVRRLAVERRGKTNVVVAGPQDASMLREYLGRHGLQDAKAVTIPTGTFKVERVPALIVANAAGQVVGAWAGTLPANQEREILRRLGLQN
jgi:hypothetical protein